ncbi:MAG: hypothetical protein PHN63_00745 [Candidatus Omnitrophica bacterium]|nr:hypothetical protein [Candidatus Omnitrophota bacterium]
MKNIRRGAVLIIVIIFIITAAISTLALYNYVYSTFRTQGVDEVTRIRGFYLTNAGIQYASILLRGHPTYIINYDVQNDNATLAHDLGLSNSENLLIKITPQADGSYLVEAKFIY